MTDTPLRAAVIGAGWYASEIHIPNLAARSDVLLDGVCRKGSAELERVRSHFGFAFASEDHRDLLARKPDVVVVASPHRYHFEHTRDALLAGAHVLCEKPFTLDPDEAWALVDLARQQDRHLLVANGYHYLPGIDGLRRRIADGLLGQIEHAMVSFVSATRDVFSGTRGLDAWQTAFFVPDETTWRSAEHGGGFAYGQLSHSLALLLFLTGLEPMTATAQTLGQGGIDLVDAGVLRMRNGAAIAVSGAAAMPSGNRALLRFVITGTKGLLEVELDRDFCLFRGLDGSVERIPVGLDDWNYNCRGPLDALVELAQGRGTNLSAGALGATTTATIAAMLTSASANGQPHPVNIARTPW